jgi:alkylated DNA repair dioxygenase AlkB
MDNIPGLYYFDNVVEHHNIIRLLDEDLDTPWKPITSSQNSRKVKHYGFAYNYRKTTAKEKLADIPDYLQVYKDTLEKTVLENLGVVVDFNQCIINNYEPGQSISKHIDSPAFGPIIGCYSIGDTTIGGKMRFTCDGMDKVDIHVKPGSLYLMSGDARYKWSHEMLKNKNGRRISITFRSI